MKRSLMLLTVLLASGCCQVRELNPKEARPLAESPDTFILDVRSVPELASGRLERAVHIPLSRLGSSAAELPEKKSRPILVYCGRGLKSQAASDMLKRLGYRRIYGLRGGLLAWRQRGYPLTKAGSPQSSR